MRSMVLVMLGCWMALAGSVATAKEPVLIKPVFPWTASGTLQVPPLQPEIPAAAAGCVVVGHHILDDGATAKQRIMQGAYTGDVTAQAQADFEGAVLERARRWRFRSAQPDDMPTAKFNTVVVGFGAASALGDTRVVVGIDRQDRRLQQACSIELSEWGNRNAIPVEQARERNDKGMLLARPGDPSLYWTGEMMPPLYPVDAARSGADACIVIGYRIGVDGVPGDYRILSTSLKYRNSATLRRQFEQASLRAVSSWRFAPGPDNLQRFPEFVQSPIGFTLGTRTISCQPVDLAAAFGPAEP